MAAAWLVIAAGLGAYLNSGSVPLPDSAAPRNNLARARAELNGRMGTR